MKTAIQLIPIILFTCQVQSVTSQSDSTEIITSVLFDRISGIKTSLKTIFNNTIVENISTHVQGEKTFENVLILEK